MKFFRKPTSLVVRLRTSLIVILVAVAVVTTFTYLQFGQVDDRKSDLLGRSLPVLVATHDLVTTLGQETEQAARLRDVNLRANFVAIREEFGNLEQQLARELAELERIPQVDASALSRASEALETTTEQMIFIQTERQKLLLRNDELIAQLAEKLDVMLDAIAAIRLDLFFALQTAPNRADQTLTYDAGIQRRIAQFNAIVELGLTIEAMKDQASGLVQSNGQGADRLAAQDLSLKMRSVSQLLAKLPDANAQRALARDLLEVRSLIADENGLLANVRAQVAFEQQLAEALTVHGEVIRGISDTIGDTLDAANQDTIATGIALDKAIRAAYASILLVTVALGLGILFVVVVIIERQLNRRIQLLIQSVRTIGEGDFAEPIEVSGRDEIGEIADSLRAFQRTARDLVRSNADLKSFAYAASHDLRSPLRAISDLAEWTMEDAKDELSTDNFEKLELLCNRTKRLTNLLNDLLSYAMADADNDERDVFDIVAEVATISDLIDPEHRFELAIDGATPPFLAYPVPTRQILHNLLSNAIKHHDKASGVITISTTQGGGQICIEVADDGPGIPLAYQDRIFKLFEKLESRDSVEGSGIGLALIHKLAKRYDGGVRVVSNPIRERGTRFVIHMSTQQAAPLSSAA